MNSYKVYIYNNQNEIDCQVCLTYEDFVLYSGFLILRLINLIHYCLCFVMVVR